ncbi:MAG TPA: cyclase family protein [Trebonia sp.]
MAGPDIGTVREYISKYSNWRRWGEDDERGTLNHVTSEDITYAASLVKKGRSISMALPDENGPQTETYNRFKPLAQVVFENKIYNGHDADKVSSKGALRNGVCNAAGGMVGRGVLLDIPRSMGVQWLEPGTAIGADDLDRAASQQGVKIRKGDFVFVRTGAIAQARAAGAWGDYAGGPAPGLGMKSIDWVAGHELAAIATDTWGMEVLPNETPDVFQPLHIVFIVHLGLWVGEIWDLEPLAADCAADGVYDFLFCGPPLPFTHPVGSPVNPLAIK